MPFVDHTFSIETTSSLLDKIPQKYQKRKDKVLYRTLYIIVGSCESTVTAEVQQV